VVQNRATAMQLLTQVTQMDSADPQVMYFAYSTIPIHRNHCKFTLEVYSFHAMYLQCSGLAHCHLGFFYDKGLAVPEDKERVSAWHGL